MFENGKFIGIRIPKDQAQRIIDHYSSYGLKVMPASDYHITLMFSTTDFDWKVCKYNTVKTDPSTYHHELLGEEKNIFVLRFDAPEFILKRRKECEKNGATPTFSDFKPHLTISYEKQEMKEVPVFPEPLELLYEYCEGLKD